MSAPRATSAGLLMYRLREERLEVLIAHPGGPFFVKKDEQTLLSRQRYQPRRNEDAGAEDAGDCRTEVRGQANSGPVHGLGTPRLSETVQAMSRNRPLDCEHRRGK